MRQLSILIPALLLVACFADFGEIDGEDNAAMFAAIPGRWRAPAEVRQISDPQHVPRTLPTSCSGGFTQGAKELKSYLLTYFPQVTGVGGYACRKVKGGTGLSVHGSGRAIDIYINTVGGQADNEAGDAVAHWLMINTKAIGIQSIIWDETSYRPAQSGSRREADYCAGGACSRKENPKHRHRNHLHVEITPEAAMRQTEWFKTPTVPPDTIECGKIPAAGGFFDEREPCLQLLGDKELWRSSEGNGDSNHMYWTDAISATKAKNWARYELDFEQAGEYEVLVHGSEFVNASTNTRYTIKAAGSVSSKRIDSSAMDGWYSLGAFRFAAGADQDVSVHDNRTGATRSEAVTVDGIWVIPWNGPPESETEDVPDDPPAQEPSGDDSNETGDEPAPPLGSPPVPLEVEQTDDSDLYGGGCTTTTTGGTLSLFLFVVAFAILRRKTEMPTGRR